MKRHGDIRQLLGIAFLLLAACGGSSAASAPPVDLPAPITGRIDVSEPDADGNLSITGEAGAVDGGAMVMAVNEAVAGTQSRLLDLFVRPAYAQGIFPGVCSEAGKACALAEADGSFIIRIAATEDDPIVIGVIDPTEGTFISGLLRRGVNSKANCAGLGLSGNAVDVDIVPGEGTPLLLFEGSDEATNRLAVGAENPKTIYLPGCYAQDLAIRSLEGTTAVAAVSADDRILWRGLYGSGLFTKMKHIVLPEAPARVAFGRSPLVVLLAPQDFASASYVRVSLVDGSAVPPAGPAMPDAFDPATVVCRRLDTIEMENGEPLAIALLDNGEGTPSFLSFIDFPRMNIIGLWNTVAWGNVVRQLRDCRIGATDSGDLLVPCAGNSASSGEFVEIAFLGVEGSGGNLIALTRDADLADVTSIQRFSLVPFTNLSSAPRRLAGSTIIAAGTGASSVGSVLASTASGELLLLDPSAQVVADTLAIAPGDDIVAIALDEASRTFFAADATAGKVVSLGDQLTWTN